MKSPRLLIASICLVYLTAFTISLSASEYEHENESEHEYESHESEHRTESSLKKARNAQKLAALRIKIQANKKKVSHTPRTPITSTGTTQTGTTTKPAPTPVTTKPVTSTPVTKSATVNYGTPEGSVPVAFSVTVKDGVIMSASSTKKAWGTSGYYQDAFAKSLSTAVVGKKAATLSLSAVGGASLTTIAFEKFVTSSF